MKNKWFYERNEDLLNHPVNKTFEEVLWMSNQEFESWIKDVCLAVASIWDEKGQPPRVGLSEKEIEHQFKQLESFPVSNFLKKDEYSLEENCIQNTSIVGNAANQWFPTMMATKINYTSDVNGGLSIYDHFKRTDLLPKMIKYGRRHFKRDSFYHYSNPLRVFDPSWDKKKRDEYLKMFLFCDFTNGAEGWIKKFESDHRSRGDWDYWIQPVKADSEYSGYGSDLTSVKWYKLTRKQIEDMGSLIPDKCKTVMNDIKTDLFQVRPFKLGQKIFPIGLKAYKISVCQYAVNFPPLTAKFLYEKFLKGKENAVIWDPSAGWGGRLLGAMSVNREVVNNIHYIGTDPNTDHNTTEGRTKYHELADFYNRVKNKGVLCFETHNNSYEIYQCGSEVMTEQPAFKKYKGVVDLVFTSPPYFAKEVYSEDPEQSAIKFNTYDLWRDGFLKPTLQTAYEWLRPGGYLLWNIADAKFGGQMLPLEKDSIDIMKSLGMEHVETLKMVLAQMPGGNRIDTEDGKPSAKNFCKLREAGTQGKGVGGKMSWYKYEPIFVFKKV